MKVHFIDVGQGNMVLIQIPGSKTILCDCNLTDQNKAKVLDYLRKQIGSSPIDIFINTHRDSDHMRGVMDIHQSFSIKELWDNGVAGTTPDSPEYRSYMSLRSAIGKEVKPQNFWTFGDCKLRIMNSKHPDFQDANEQSLVIKLEYNNTGVMLAGDTSYKPWKEFIEKKYSVQDLQSDILLASHHGSISFFDDPSDPQYYYVSHLKKINPAMTIISVGDNNTHPEPNALKLYETHSRGSRQGNKVFTTRDKGNLLLTFPEPGSWNLKVNNI